MGPTRGRGVGLARGLAVAGGCGAAPRGRKWWARPASAPLSLTRGGAGGRQGSCPEEAQLVWTTCCHLGPPAVVRTTYGRVWGGPNDRTWSERPNVVQTTERGPNDRTWSELINGAPHSAPGPGSGPSHRPTVAGQTRKHSAARPMDQPSTTRRARRRRPPGVKGAPACAMKASSDRTWASTPHPAQQASTQPVHNPKESTTRDRRTQTPPTPSIGMSPFDLRLDAVGWLEG